MHLFEQPVVTGVYQLLHTSASIITGTQPSKAGLADVVQLGQPCSQAYHLHCIKCHQAAVSVITNVTQEVRRPYH